MAVTGPGVSRLTGSASELHGRAGPIATAAVEVLDVEGPALVLGSTQPTDVVDEAACLAAGVELARRRSGGGVVLVDPGELLWLDVLLPRSHPHWTEDVSSSAWWLGEAWVDALGDAGVAGASVHRGSLCLNRWGRLVCFAGLGGGEVTLGDGGAKVVGISQRRTKDGARFQCAVPLAWDAERLVSLLRFDSDDDRAEALADLRSGVVAPVTTADADTLVDALLVRLATVLAVRS